MVQKVKLKTVKDRTIETKNYGEKKPQTITYKDQKIPVMVREYGFESIKYIVDEIRKGQEKDWDRIVLITGGEGDGKSTLGAHLAARLGMSDASKVKFESKGYMNSLKNTKEKGVTWLDEGTRAMYKRDAMTKSSRKLMKAFHQIRAKKLASIICLPSKGDMDSDIRDRRVDYWGHVKTRGYRRGFVIWRVAGSKGRLLKFLKGENIGSRIPKHDEEWQSGTFWEPLFYTRFPVFRDHNGFEWEEYDKRKMKKLDEFLEEDEREETPSKVVPNLAAMIKWGKEKMGKSVEDLVNVSGLSKPSVYRYLKKPVPEDSVMHDGNN